MARIPEAEIERLIEALMQALMEALMEALPVARLAQCRTSSGTARMRLDSDLVVAAQRPLCTFAPVLMVMMAIERVGATLTAQTGMLGPLATIVMGWWLLDEPMNAWIAAGTALVLAGVWLLTRATRPPVR